MTSEQESDDVAAVRAAEARFYAALRRVHLGRVDDLLACWSSRAEVTTMNAAGGHEQGPNAVAARWRWWSTQGRAMPATRVEPLALHVTPELAYTVALEHHGERMLRVTHIYVREDGDWKVVHRHADPLVNRQG